MTQKKLQRKLEKMAEKDYREFSQALIPGVKNMLGIRLPNLRVLAKEMAKEDWKDYLSWDSFLYFEEIMLQGMILGYVKAPVDEILRETEQFIPRIDNWSVNDSFCVTFRHASACPEQVWDFLMRYRDSHLEYEVRVVAVMLMSHFLLPAYIDSVFDVLKGLDTKAYYASMAVAWAFAEAWAKFPQKTKRYLEDDAVLDRQTRLRMLQKGIESRRIPAEDKEWMRWERKRLRS